MIDFSHRDPRAMMHALRRTIKRDWSLGPAAVVWLVLFLSMVVL